MTHLPTLITDMALVLMVAGVMTLLCRKLRQPVIIGYVLAGFLLGPVVDFFPTIGDAVNINTLAEMGIIFLMFALGLEFSVNKLAQAGATAVAAEAVHMLGMIGLGYLAGSLLGWSAMDSIFLGAMLAISSTIIVIKSLENCGLRNEPFAGDTIGRLILEDVAAVFIMLVLTTISVSRGGLSADLFGTIALLLFYLALWLSLGILIVPSIMRRLEPLLNDETLLVVALGICFGMVCLANVIGFSTAFGAFLSGSILAGIPLAERIEKLVAPLKDLFIAVFFVSVGLLVVPATLFQYLLPIVLICVVAVIGKALLLSVSLCAMGQGLQNSLRGAFSQTQVGEFSFIIAGLGVSLGVTSDFLYPVIVAVAVLTTFSTPFLLRAADPLAAWLGPRLPAKLLARIERGAQKEARAKKPTREETWPHYLTRYCGRILLYGVIIAGIIEVGVVYGVPLACEYLDDTLARVAVCALIYLLILPFLPGLLIYRRQSFTELWLKNKKNQPPLVALIGVRVGVAVTALIMPLLLIFHLPWYILLLIAVPVAILASRSPRLRGQHLQIQAQFLANLNERRLSEAGADLTKRWLDQQVYVREYICGKGFAEGKTLKELDWGRRLHINVIKIIRGHRHLNIPNGDVMLLKHDRFFLLGNERTLRNFEIYARSKGLDLTPGEEAVTLHSFAVDNEASMAPKDQLLVYAVPVQDDDTLENNSIRDADLRNRWSCLIIGLERESVPILDPGVNMVLREGDKIWVLGTQKMAAILLETDVIH